MSGGDWGGYKAIAEEAKRLSEAEKQQPEVACPVCGTPLDVNSAGAGNCPMGHYRTNNARRA